MNWLKRFGAYLNPIEHNKPLVRLLGQLTDTYFYNWRPGTTTRLAAGIANSGKAVTEHLVIGDGQSYHASPAGYWPTIYRDRLEAAGVPIAGSGWVRAGDGVNAVDSRIVKTGTWTVDQFPAIRSVDPTATLKFTSDRPGSIVQVAYLNNGAKGPFTIAVDDGAPVTVTPDGTDTVGIWTAPAGLPVANHTITVQPTSTTEVSIVGFQVSKPTGLKVHNLALNGGQAIVYSNASQPNRHGFAVRALVPNPDVVHIAFGPVEAIVAKPIPTLIAELTAIRDIWPAANIVLHLPFQPDKVEAWWPIYAAALYDLADRLDVALINAWAKAGGSYTAAQTAGLMANASYPNATGSAWWAMLAFTAVNVPSILPTAAPQPFSADDETAPKFAVHAVPGGARGKRKAE